MNSPHSSRSDTADGQPRTEMPRFPGLEVLAPYRVHEMMLVSSWYDSFILEEDGHISELLLEQYRQLDLWYAPRLTRAPTAASALEQLDTDRRFDMVVPTIRIGAMEPTEFAAKVKEWNDRMPVVMLGYESPELQRLIEQRRADPESHPIDRIMVWTGDARILLVLAKMIEDERNAHHDTQTTGVNVILFVEDSVRFASSYLPMLYTELMLHGQSLIADGVNLSQKVLRMRARPKILWCETYEEAIKTYDKYQDNVLGVVSDVRFPRRGRLDDKAGFHLARELKADRRDLPILLQSTDMTNIAQAVESEADFVHKLSPWLAHDVRRFMLENFGFGPFVFRLPDGSEVAQANDLRHMEDALTHVPAESLRYHGERNHFSTWLKARTMFRLARQLRPIVVSDFPSIEAMRRVLVRGLLDARREEEGGAVADFDPDTFDCASGFARIGGGSLGGKARGLAFTRKLLRYLDDENNVCGDTNVYVPPSIVIGTDFADRFIEENDLAKIAMAEPTDRALIQEFQNARLPSELIDALSSVLDIFDQPLAVRSSSLLEDSLEQPFAGIYGTYMLPNSDSSRKKRLADLCAAIKMVLATSYTKQARAYMKALPHDPDRDHMAVIIQQLVGRSHGTRFYPHLSGVARSYNYYPFGSITPEDGVAYVALGMGRTVVDGMDCLRFCPRYPRQLPQFSSVEDILDNCQKHFYALDMDHHGTTLQWFRGEDLTRHPIEDAGKDGTLSSVCSYYIPADNIIAEGASRGGHKVVTFAPILKHNLMPLAAIIKRLLELGSHGMSAPVEIEFAANLPSVQDDKPGEFACLQMRPLVVMSDVADFDELAKSPENHLCNSPHALGNGRVDGIRDVVCVLPELYDETKSMPTATAVGEMNEWLRREDRPFLLIGPGRWGSSDPWLGIPVHWGQISGAKVVIETCMPTRSVTPSEGSHFFQNLTAFKVGYIMVNPELKRGHIDWEWLKTQHIEREGINGLRWYRLDQPITTLIDGRSNRAIILKDGCTP
ncbi:MAG: histidine kinase [Planctomycetes bacterium]|nr:histidine kinase [Planctomycetota bacterium]NOG53889.1 histidine kinase [Planctomycetota bacterium]